MPKRNYNDRHRVREALDTQGLLHLMEVSNAGEFDHKPTEYPHPSYGEFGDGVHLVSSRWLRNSFQGKRVAPFYGIEVSATYENQDNGVPPYHGTHDSGIKLGQPWGYSPENNRYSTAPIGSGSFRFECPIEEFHKVERSCVVVFPCSDIMSERDAREHKLLYEKAVSACRTAVQRGEEGLDPYIMWVNLPQLIEEGSVWKKGSWGYYLKENPVDYSGLEGY